VRSTPLRLAPFRSTPSMFTPRKSLFSQKLILGTTSHPLEYEFYSTLRRKGRTRRNQGSGLSGGWAKIVALFVSVAGKTELRGVGSGPCEV
jgi:hypothetical protein